MSLLNKLYIQGIRSFGLDREDEQKIEFTPPVTFIVGENGSGKTAIIECLKYAITGDLPSGSDRGKSFVHESSLYNNRATVAGNVKLTVSNSQNVNHTVTRSLKFNVSDNNKRDKRKIQVSITKQEEDITYSIDNADTYMCNVMGVSKSILNNVIFCHQEDSNWPLDEGKKLKEKFDTIFGTTQYNKAIDKIIKIRKEYQEQLKDIEKDVEIYKERMQQVNKIKNKIETHQAELDKKENECKELSEKLQTLEKQKSEVLEKEANCIKLKNEKVMIKNLYETKAKDYKNLSEKLTKNESKMEDDLKILTAQLTNHENDKNNQAKLMESLEKECTELKKLMEENRKNVDILKEKKLKFEVESQSLQNLLSLNSQKLRELSLKLNITFDDENQLAKGIEQGITHEKQHLQYLTKVRIENSEINQKNIDDARQKYTKLEAEISMQQKLIKEKNENIEKITQEIANLENQISTFEEVEVKIEEIEKNLEELNESKQMEKMMANQESLQNEISNLENAQAELDKIIEFLHSISHLTAELDSKQKEINQNMKEFENLKSESETIFAVLFPNTKIETKFHQQIQEKQKELKNFINEMEAKIKVKQNENDRFKFECDSLHEIEENLKNDIKKIEENIRNLCGEEDFSDVFEAQKEKVDKMKMELALLESSKNYNNNYIEKINKTPCCPLCCKKFENEEAEKMIIKLRESNNQLPEKIATVQSNLKVETLKYDKLNEINPSYKNLQEFKNKTEIIKDKIKNLEKNIVENQKEIDSFKISMREPKDLCNLITTNVHTDMMKLDNLQQEIIKRTLEIEIIKSKIPENTSEINLDEARKKRGENSVNIKIKKVDLKTVDDKIKEYNETLMNTRIELQNLEIQKNEYKNKLQELEKLKKNAEKFRNEKSNLEGELKTFEQQIEPLKTKLEDSIAKKKACNEEIETKIQDQQTKVNDLNLEENEIENLKKQIQALKSKNLEWKIDQISKDIQEKKQKINLEQENLEKKERKIEEIRINLGESDMILYNIQDNISYRTLQNEIIEYEEKHTNIRNSIRELNYEQIIQDKEKIIEEITNISSKQNQLLGETKSLSNAIEENEKELKEDLKLRNAEKQLKNSVSKEEVLKYTIADLTAYRAILEKKLLQFHEEKMEQINSSIKHLWNEIYKGNDIDFIKIKTNEENIKSTDKRRNYNYRVMQQKLGGEWTEMRGRCSAGQKVLASLIIRIALADTFSAKCGILALDEPTTNLDEKNVKSLSRALARLVSQRNDGRFMLIIITHDESFIASLDQADKYYHVFNNRGISNIEEVRN